MPVLKYRDPTTGDYLPIPGVAGPPGADGPAGPEGPPGPEGPAGEATDLVTATVALTGGQLIPLDTLTTLVWDTLVYDSGEIVAYVADGPMVPEDGLYLVSGQVSMDFSGAGFLQLWTRYAYLAGGAMIWNDLVVWQGQIASIRSSESSAPTTANFAVVLNLVASDVIPLQVRHYGTGGSRSTTSGPVWGTRLTITSLKGAMGPEGPAGGGSMMSGSSGRFFDYTYDPDMGPMAHTTSSVPDGTLHFDTALQSEATILYVSTLTSSGVDVSVRLASLPVGTVLWVQDRGDASMHATYIITGLPTYDEAMGMWAIPVSYDPAGSAAELVAGETVLAGALETPPTPFDPAEVSYRHYQSSAASTWIIDHGLGFRPSVTVVDSAGVAVWPNSVTYPSDTRVSINFTAALGGEAYLS